MPTAAAAVDFANHRLAGTLGGASIGGTDFPVAALMSLLCDCARVFTGFGLFSEGETIAK